MNIKKEYDGVIEENLNPEIEFLNVLPNEQKNVSIINDDELLKAYIGENSDIMLKSKWNIWFCFFGVYYLLYRKMYYLAFIWVMIAVLIKLCLGSSIIAKILILILIVFVCRYFNEIYISVAKEEIKMIKKENVYATQEELIKICSKKGGVSYWVVGLDN